MLYKHHKHIISEDIKQEYGLKRCSYILHTLSKSVPCTGFVRPTPWFGIVVCDTCKDLYCQFCSKKHKGICKDINLRDKTIREGWVKKWD
uniref:Uncharacterized protein n=1 Tax=viral metagenome TaxID=1070528 RepID=A0A6C0J9Y3_9ZZZZ